MPEPIVPDYFPTPRKPLFRRQTRRRLKVAGIIIGSLFVILLIAGRPAVHAVRAWQARKHAERAFAMIEQQKWNEARNEATAAYQLRPNEPEALRAVARLLSRVGQIDGLEFWKKLSEVTPLTAEDLRDEIRIAVKTNDLSTANDAVQQLLAGRGYKVTVTDYLLAADVALRRHDYKTGAVFAEKVLADPTATRADQLRATLGLDTIVRSGNASVVSEPDKIGSRLVALSAGDDDTSLEALTALGQYSLASTDAATGKPPMPVTDIISRLNHHPKATIASHLLAADLEISQDSTKRDQIEQREIDRWKRSSNEDLAALGAWLYRRGDYQLVLEAISPEKAMQIRDLFMQRLDALVALQRWEEIRKVLESERYPLDPMIQNVYLALCYAREGQQVSADNSWQRAIENAAGDVNKLLGLAGFAEKNGVGDVAATAFNAAVAVSPKSLDAQLGRLRLVRATGDTRKIYSAVTELLKIWPNDTNLQNDELYLRLLLLPPDTKADASELNSIRTAAEKLVQGQPNSFPHRTVLALALLKQNQPYSALSLYRNLTISRNAVTPSTVAVHAAVLNAAGETAEAKVEAAKVPPDKLLPEERALVAHL